MQAEVSYIHIHTRRYTCAYRHTCVCTYTPLKPQASFVPLLLRIECKCVCCKSSVFQPKSHPEITDTRRTPT
ncbi:hypothetical protein NP493_42g08045 [Ridgeia piscesae]|uniref:Uncharacterized protein n=1 Tax=Ridgeia piscesae TaxID=27915 RepID=A0AAD9PBW0_RIDPI|nr:hypothetical protein NP493_42g08045 [Ridgeia piscesae]